MYNLALLETAATTTANGEVATASPWFLIIWFAVIGLVFYFLIIRPQKKQQKQLSALISSLEVGDSVLTTSGFYGVVIDVMEEVIVVEFGSNKNCRIPMKKNAIVEVEKPLKEGAKEVAKDEKETKESK